MNLEKLELRKIYRQKRASLSSSEVIDRSRKIAQNFIKNLLPKIDHENRIFAIYLQSGNEVGTGLIAEYFEKNRIKFSYPKIARNNYPLEFIAAEENQNFFPNPIYPKIFEPEGKKVIPDILIIPLLAFDKKCSRLGSGGGFYDRTIQFLRRKNPKLITIGLAYEIQCSSGLSVEKTDEKLDFIVTEKTIFS
jgi:5-formyltetrahydrofolate cyclo-ligase